MHLSKGQAMGHYRQRRNQSIVGPAQQKGVRLKTTCIMSVANAQPRHWRLCGSKPSHGGSHASIAKEVVFRAGPLGRVSCRVRARRARQSWNTLPQ